ncbi:MAG TPA: ImmA/IrrE family metallo-endopeptidase [Pirellulales bacterium]|nr:ImmA/IrrE family metallo-endopeptidase [Pirellulales bacterium]
MTTQATTPFIAQAEIEKRAADVLRTHGLYSVPVDPVTLANREGIKVHNARFSDESLSGMISKRGDAVTMLVNQSDPPYRKRFTIAHELGHHFLHLLSDGDFVDSTIDLFRENDSGADAPVDQRRPEIQANQFAAALLMPADLVRQEFNRTQDLLELAKTFNVSEAAMGFRLSRLGLV